MAVLSVVLSPAGVDAAPPPPCPGRAEDLQLEPLEAFVDGGRVLRGTNGRYSTDAGFEFGVEFATLSDGVEVSESFAAHQRF